MSKKVKFIPSSKGFIELFTSEAMNDYLQSVGDSIADMANGLAIREGAEYGARSHNADRTAICNVYVGNLEAYQDNLDHNTLEKALGSSGLPRTKKGAKR